MTDDPEEILTLDDPPAESRQPLHIWANPKHDSIEAMTAGQAARLATSGTDEPGFNERFEQALLDVGIPAALIQPTLAAIAPVRADEVDAGESAAIHRLVWLLDGADGAAFRRSLGFLEHESDRECAALEGVPKTTLKRKVAKLLGKWTSHTH